MFIRCSTYVTCLTYFFVRFFADADRATSIAMFGGSVAGAQSLTSLHGSSGGGNASNSTFYPENFVQHQPRLHHGDEDGHNPFSSGYHPVPVASEPHQHIRLQSPPNRLNHRNRHLNHHSQRAYDTVALTGTSLLVLLWVRRLQDARVRLYRHIL